MLLAMCLLAVVALGHGKSISTVDDSWELFKSTYEKSYEGDMELARKFIFQENLEYIRQHNFDADLGKHSYWLGVNKYADWSNEEFRAFMNGYKHQNISTGSVFLSPANLGDLPTSVDWRQKGYVTPVKNQEECGSCWAFSATGSLEGQHFRKTYRLVSLSEQNLVDCSVAQGTHGCEGGWMGYAFNYVQQNKGIDTEVCYPYEAVERNCRYRSSCSGSSCTGHVDIPTGDENALKIAVATVGPISVAIDASHPSFRFHKNGVYNEPKCGSAVPQLDHAVLVVGYGTSASGLSYWLVKNSWGVTWGANGYILMSRNRNNQCGIATAAVYPLV